MVSGVMAFFLFLFVFFFSGQDNWTKISFFLLNSNCLLNNVKSDFSTLKPGKTINPEKISHIIIVQSALKIPHNFSFFIAPYQKACLFFMLFLF